MSIEERLAAAEADIVRLKRERAGAKLDEVSQQLRSHGFDLHEIASAVANIRYDQTEMRAESNRRFDQLGKRLSSVEQLLIAIAAHLGVGEGQS